ncbi:unnamed protein product [Mytilus edulis]|uniref:Uncharacterized protein n=1 Tax=Mytilus edulis TaxID=6550 RepID=A0A8S3SWC2_MYTED|nr:unnamed protein product [Mytilus edulis]
MDNHRETRLNVLLIMIESTSRINSVRYLHKTRKYLLETLNATDLLGYNKVADNSSPNMAALLTGDFIENSSCFKDSEGVDKCPFIWKEFSKLGYTTHYGQDTFTPWAILASNFNQQIIMISLSMTLVNRVQNIFSIFASMENRHLNTSTKEC